MSHTWGVIEHTNDRALSRRERQILELAAGGLTDKAIANEMGISPTTVNTFWGRIRTKMGSSTRTQLVATLMREENERLLFEIAQRKRMEDAVAVSEDKCRMLLESAPDAIVVVRMGGAIDLINRRAEEAFGYSREELIGRPIEVLLPRRLRKIHRNHRWEFNDAPHRRVMGSGMRLVGLRKDGTEFLIEIGLSPMRLGDEFFVIASIRDIAEYHAAAQRIASQNAMEEALIGFSAQGFVISTNAAADKLHGFKAVEFVGRHFSSLVMQEEVPRCAEVLKKVLAGRTINIHLQLRRKSGRSVAAEATFSPVKTRDGVVTGMSAMLRKSPASS